MRIAIVAAEPSGDLLGGEIVSALRQYFSDAEFVGVAGTNMLAQGVKTLFPLEKISVMGFTEVLCHLFTVLKLRAMVRETFLQNPPDIYIGIDAPDFNLPIERALKKAGIKTVHCNSPTIWAWRKNRIKKIGLSVNLMLTLFPFELAYYQAEQIPAKYIGHPLADKIPLRSDQSKARKALSLPENKRIIALLPGSRRGEIKYISPVLLAAAKLYLEKFPETIFISSMVNDSRLEEFLQQKNRIAENLPLQIMMRKSQEVLSAADGVMLASGTATLEAMLCKKPMVVMYRGSSLSAWIARKLFYLKHFSLPNILADESLVPEFFQETATPENVANALINLLSDSQKIALLEKRFLDIHQQLRCHASEKAAEAVKEIVDKV